MSYLVLARKYRPRTFAEVAGQEVATRTLQGAIQEHRIGHAYLFHGPRGTGKTTSARVFAKALICAKGPALEPCLECEQCRDVENGSHVDVIEIDAASNRQIDDVRELRERVAYAPMRARFKVYIVDEVHMLTGPAFNALLKTLEEPPAHVKFLFATTEVEKVIETVRSRCQLVKLELIRPEVIAARLTEIFGRENIDAAPGVADELAKLARGSLRDALSISDQLIALVGNQPTREDVRRVAPAGGPEEIDALLTLVERGDKAAVLTALPAGEGHEPELLGALLDHLRTALLCRLRPAEAQLFESDAALRQKLVARADRLGGDRLELWLEDLLLARERCERLPRHARVVLELALLDLCRKETTQPLSALAERLAALEQRLAQGAPAPSASLRAAAPANFAPSAPPAPAPRATPPVSAPPSTSAALTVSTPPTFSAPPRASAPATASRAPSSPAVLTPARPSSAPVASNAAAWNAMLDALRATRAPLVEALERRAKLVDFGGGRATIQVGRVNDAERALLFDPSVAAECQAALSRIAGSPITVALEDSGRRAPGANDPFTRAVADVFQGQIEELER